MKEWSHLDEQGKVQMVDVGSKEASQPTQENNISSVQEWSKKRTRTQTRLQDRNPSGEKSAQIGTVPHLPHTELILSYLVGKGAEGFKMTLID